MGNRRAAVVIVVWYVATLAIELTAGLAFAMHAGWLGGLPIATAPVSVMIVEETSEKDKLTPGQLAILTSHAPESFLAWIKTHGEKDIEGDYRIVDKDDSMEQDKPKWKAAFAAKGPTVPWLVVMRGEHVLLSEALPKTAEETMRELKRFGGQ